MSGNDGVSGERIEAVVYTYLFIDKEGYANCQRAVIGQGGSASGHQRNCAYLGSNPRLS